MSYWQLRVSTINTIRGFSECENWNPSFGSMWYIIFYLCASSEVSDLFCLLHQEDKRMCYSISFLNLYPGYLRIQERVSLGFSREVFNFLDLYPYYGFSTDGFIINIVLYQSVYLGFLDLYIHEILHHLISVARPR